MPHLHWKVLLLVLLVSPGISFTQDTTLYHLSLKKEIGYTALGVVSIGGAEMLRKQTSPVLKISLPELDLPDIDEVAFNYNNQNKANEWSDYTMFSSVGLNALLLLNKKTRHDFGRISLLLTETMLINGGLTNLSKATFRRPRPYVYDPNWAPDRLVKSTDRTSMVSGHTSGAAAGAFFFARTFSDYYPESRLKPYVWGVAATLPALTGYLRIKANKHYPSDVIAGYCLGATIGYLVPALHRKPFFNGKLRLKADQEQFSLSLNL